MTVRNLAIDPTTGDLVVAPGGGLVLVSDAAAIQQAIASALRAVQGEWFLDATVGVPYFQQILVKNPNLPLVRQVFTDAILAVPGVRQLVSIDLQYDQPTRTLRVAWRALCDQNLLVTGQTGIAS